MIGNKGYSKIYVIFDNYLFFSHVSHKCVFLIF